MMLKLMEIKSNEIKLTQKQVFKQLGYSDSTFKRYRDDMIIDSPYIGSKNRKKIKNQILRQHNPQVRQQMKILKVMKTLIVVEGTI